MFKDFATIKKLSDELALYEKSLEFGKGFKTVYGGNLDDYEEDVIECLRELDDRCLIVEDGKTRGLYCKWTFPLFFTFDRYEIKYPSEEFKKCDYDKYVQSYIAFVDDSNKDCMILFRMSNSLDWNPYDGQNWYPYDEDIKKCLDEIRDSYLK